jgi:hypothetical protein
MKGKEKYEDQFSIHQILNDKIKINDKKQEIPQKDPR